MQDKRAGEDGPKLRAVLHLTPVSDAERLRRLRRLGQLLDAARREQVQAQVHPASLPRKM